MADGTKPLYGPALRLKLGELQGVRDLAPDVADCVLPRMIVPPLPERDESLQARLFEGDQLPNIASPLAAHWAGRDALIESTHLIDEMGRDQLAAWLPRMFELARASQVQAIPLVQLRDILSPEAVAYRAALDRQAKLQFGLVMSSGDIGDGEALRRAMGVLDSMGLAAEQCVAIADFHDADLSSPEIVAPIIGGALDYLRSAAPWRQVIFQGTNFPEKNPAEADGYALVLRNEWAAWRQAVAFDPETADYLMFGDYAADCSKLAFGEGGGRAIRHYRYTTPDAWYVRRGSKTGRDQEIMKNVCREVVESGHFAGRDFSSADDFIFLTAKGLAGPGNATGWRAVNTTHHITRVVTDMGSLRGREFVRKTALPPSEQKDLFEHSAA